MIIEMPPHIHQEMTEFIRRAGYKQTEYNRLLSIGKMYHILSLVLLEDSQPQETVVIYVQQYKPQYVKI
jgi:hypothetical protein